MKSTMRLSLCGIMLLLGVAQGIAEDQIPWVADFRSACGMAAEQRRLVLLHFYNDNCEWCVRLDQNVLSKPEVTEAIAQNYVAVKVHAGKQPQLATRYQVKSFPTDVFVTPSGLEVYRTISQQKPADYIAVLDQVAQQTGVGAPREWKSQLGQATQFAAKGAAAAANDIAADARRASQQATGDAQSAVGQMQQRWGSAVGQFQNSADQSRALAQQTSQQFGAAGQQAQQQATGAIQQGAGVTKQWSQQANDAVQHYEQQAGDTYRQFRDQAGQTGQQMQQQAQAAGQQWQTAAQQTAQQYGEVARDLKNQWQQATGSSPLDRRSAFVPLEPSPASQSGLAAPGGAAAPPTNPPTANPPLTSAGPSVVATPQGPQVTDNPWVVGKRSESSNPATSPATSSTAAAPAAGNQMLVAASEAPPIALDGFCPVTLLDTVARDPNDRSAWRKGDRRFGAIHRGRTYLFTSAENQQKFLANPDAYAPALAGCDPVRYAERGEVIDGKRAYGLITPDRRIYLFADETSRNRFEQSPGAYTNAIQQAMQRSDSGNLYR